MSRLRRFLVRTRALARKEVLHAARDRQVIYLALGMPLVLVLIFGYAVSFDVEGLGLAVLDQDHSPAAVRLRERLHASDAFEVVREISSPEEIEPLLRRGEVRAVVVIPPDFSRRLARNQTAVFQAVIDGSDGTTARVALGYTAEISQAQTLELLRQAGLGSGRLPLEPRVRAFHNPAMRSALFVVPGLVAVVVGILAVLLTALAVAREWERGSMEQLFATPVARLPVVLGKLLPYVVLGVVQLLLVLTAGAWLFDVPFRGSAALLALASVLFLVCVLGQGLLISMVTRNQQVATQAGAVSAMLPALLLSGFLFPIENMPALLRGISYAVPARYMIVCLRGILLQGHGLAQLWPQLVGLAVLALVLVAGTTLKFRRRLD
jgi:ABC-2 type transport system permease protein